MLSDAEGSGVPTQDAGAFYSKDHNDHTVRLQTLQRELVHVSNQTTVNRSTFHSVRLESASITGGMIDIVGLENGVTQFGRLKEKRTPAF